MKQHINSYYNLEQATESVRQGEHRNWVGGLWDEIGRLQLEFLRNRGLSPEMNILDVGCGCLRGGVRLVDYMEPGRYYGIDISQALLDAGYEIELAQLGLQHKLPRDHLLCDSQFRADHFGVTFDAAIAQSLFTHLPLNHIKLCLSRLVDAVRVNGIFYATVFLCAEDQDWAEPLTHIRGGITTHPVDDPYHYRPTDLANCVTDLPWRFELIGEWQHPRDQSMVMFTRTSR